MPHYLFPFQSYLCDLCYSLQILNKLQISEVGHFSGDIREKSYVMYKLMACDIVWW